MLKLPIPEEVFELAEKRISEMPVLKGSHRGSEANEVGCLGEIIIEQILESINIPFEFVGATTHDLRVGQELWEVKTKDRTVVPKSFYDCSVPLYNSDHQVVDRYVFVSLYRPKGGPEGLRRFTHAYVVGTATRECIFEQGRVWKAGDVDESNGTKFWTDCVNIPISKLDPFMLILAQKEIVKSS